MEQLVLYASPMSSAVTVMLALAELDVPHEFVNVDIAAGDQHKPQFLALNPNGKVPTLVVDGKPMFESLAILQWLGERFGVARGLWPAADTRERFEAMSWSAWTYVTFGASMQRRFYATSDRFPAACRNEALAELAADELQAHLRLLQARLDGRLFLLGDGFSLLDVTVGCAVAYAATCGMPTDDHPRVAAWIERIIGRDTYARVWGVAS